MYYTPDTLLYQSTINHALMYEEARLDGNNRTNTDAMSELLGISHRDY